MSVNIESENRILPSKSLMHLFNGLNNLWNLVHGHRKPSAAEVVELIQLARQTQHQAHTEDLEIKAIKPVPTDRKPGTIYKPSRRYRITGKNMDW